jgi:hypothetical protein
LPHLTFVICIKIGLLAIAYLRQKQFSAKTFEEYGLQGTPSAILIDKKDILRQTVFGSNGKKQKGELSDVRDVVDELD